MGPLGYLTFFRTQPLDDQSACCQFPPSTRRQPGLRRPPTPDPRSLTGTSCTCTGWPAAPSLPPPPRDGGGRGLASTGGRPPSRRRLACSVAVPRSWAPPPPLRARCRRCGTKVRVRSNSGDGGDGEEGESDKIAPETTIGGGWQEKEKQDHHLRHMNQETAVARACRLH